MLACAGSLATLAPSWARQPADENPPSEPAQPPAEPAAPEGDAAAGEPDPAPAEAAKPEADAPSSPEGAPPAQDDRGRRVVAGPPTTLAFKDVTVADIVPFIVEVTGKVVMPQQAVMSRKITVLNDRPIPREEALDLVVLALQQNGVAVVETDRTVTLRDVGEVTRQDVPVLGPDESTLLRRDLGTIVEKIFTLRFNTAKKMGDVIKVTLPDFAKLSVDEESNQLAVLGNVGLLQTIELRILALDRPAAGALTTETFRLRYADATQIKNNINDLFGEESSSRRQQDQSQRGFRFPGQQAEQAGSTSTEIRVTSNTQQNSVTVVADPAVLAQIRQQIEDEWDEPLPEEAVTPRIYDLKHSDPVKVASLLQGLFGSATGATGGGGGGNQQGQGGQQAQGSAPASGQGVGRLAGQFSFQAIPDAGRLVVVAKSPDNITVIDRIIEGIDQPQSVGLPEVVELKHANAEDLAEQLNALLAQDGTLAQIRRAASGLSEGGSTGASPFAQDATTQTNNDQPTTSDTLAFWWQRSRTPTDRRSASNLIGQLRIVPVWRQNALLVVAPPEYRTSIIQLVAQLDKPGRQVLISAIVAEMSRDDALNLGLRWSSQSITPTNGDNSISVTNSAQGTENNFATSLFDTSVLNTEVNLNVLLQALSQKTAVSILSEPKIFTSDNQEAEFFDGQDIPFVTDSQTNQQGNLVQSFDYRAVGIQLRARPRITVQGDVDLRVNLELSSIVPGQTLFGGFVVDRRETTTQLIVKDKQTIVISGILREETTNIVRKVPLLGDIPLLGWFFKSRDKSTSNTELLVFITPIVVNNTTESGPANEHFIDRLDSLRDETRGIKPKRGEPKKPGAEPLRPAEDLPVFRERGAGGAESGEPQGNEPTRRQE
jgi:general secretion pathway protein D